MIVDNETCLESEHNYHRTGRPVTSVRKWVTVVILNPINLTPSKVSWLAKPQVSKLALG